MAVDLTLLHCDFLLLLELHQYYLTITWQILTPDVCFI